MLVVHSFFLFIAIHSISEKDYRVYKLSFGPGHEIWQILSRLQANAEDSTPRKSQAGHYCQERASSKVRLLRSRVSPLKLWEAYGVLD